MAFPPTQEYYMMLIAKLKAFVTASEAIYSGMVDPGTKMGNIANFLRIYDLSASARRS